MRPKKDMRRWLRNLRPMDSFAGLVLKHGEWFCGRATVAEYEIAVAWKKKRRPRAQECFYNAQQFCVDHREVAYWEGYYLTRGIPMHHAWVVMSDGRVVDFTLEAVLRKAKKEGTVVDETTPLYRGMYVPRAAILKHILDVGRSEPIAESYYQ